MSTTVTSLRPVTDVEVITSLAERTAEALEKARRIPLHTLPWEGVCGGETAENDAGTVPAGYSKALSALARDAGYSIRLGGGASDWATLEALGATMGPVTGDPGEWPAWTVTIKPGMSAASTARVMGHELGHALLAHPGRSMTEAGQVADDRHRRYIETGNAECTEHEVAVELATYAVCREAGIGTGRFSLEFIASRLPWLSTAELERAKQAADLTARVMWSAVGRTNGVR